MYTSLIECFEETVRKKPDSLAVEHNEETVTFYELNRRVTELVRGINIIVDEYGPIAVYLPKSIDAIVADLTVLKSGAYFMNLDVTNPADRIKSIVNHIRPVAMITSKKYRESECIQGLDITIICVDEDLHDCVGCKEWHTERMSIDTDPMCIINTSGSTGIPKGVVLNHRSFFDFFTWADEEYHFDGTEIIGSLSPIVFDIFEFELCMLMCKGSKIILLDSMLASFPVRLLEVVRDKRVNFLFWVPSIMVNIANMDLLCHIELPDIRTIWFAGEVFPTNHLCYWYDHLTKADFSNLYGPIEITLDCTFYRIKNRPNEMIPIPIGVPCRNTDVLILNENDELCGDEQDGELCVRGTSLAMGYYNEPEKTRKVFVQNPLNLSYPELIYRTGDIVYRDKEGIIHYKGRRDSLIKHLGYRIELGEIEHIITNELKLVDYCCAVYNHKDKRIVLIYEGDTEIPEKSFIRMLKQKVPTYMIPGKYKRMGILPRNNNGKIDRLKLQEEENED